MGCPFMVQLSNSNLNRSYYQTRAQRKRVAAEKEEQRRECALTFEKSRSKRYKACSDVVPVTGLDALRALGCFASVAGASSRLGSHIPKKDTSKEVPFLVPVTGLEPVR